MTLAVSYIAQNSEQKTPEIPTEENWPYSSIATCTFDRDEMIITWSEKMQEITGIPAAPHNGDIAAIGCNIQTILGSLPDAEFYVYSTTRLPLLDEQQPLAELLKPDTDPQDTPSRRIIRFTHPNGDKKYVEIRAQCLQEGTGIILDDVTREFDLKHKLEIQREELKSILSTIAHDLRGPIGCINSVTERLINESALTEEQIAEFIQALNRQSGKAVTLIEEVIGMFRDKPKIEQIEVTSMKQIINSAIVRNQTPGNTANIQVQEKMTPVMGDRARLAEIFSNLISNAIKYGGDPVQIRIGCKKVNLNGKPYVYYYVIDNGQGLTKEEQQRLFQFGETLARVKDKNTHGIGLWAMRHLVEEIGGHIGIQSEPGKGSTFGFVLPRAR
ncbi:HAMP domain-containing histidine kinase [Candidatus Dojkabacteria bacterium]|nr:HAMP domain-containing histidine kinase [Candidatus Dojkabacteria bacterium]